MERRRIAREDERISGGKDDRYFQYLVLRRCCPPVAAGEWVERVKVVGEYVVGDVEVATGSKGQLEGIGGPSGPPADERRRVERHDRLRGAHDIGRAGGREHGLAQASERRTRAERRQVEGSQDSSGP